MENSYLNTAVVDFDHGVGYNNYLQDQTGQWHYMFEDQSGPIWYVPGTVCVEQIYYYSTTYLNGYLP